MNFVMGEMDAMHTGGGWFFWTWKIGNESVTGTVQAPMWSYQLGLQNGTCGATGLVFFFLHTFLKCRC